MTGFETYCCRGSVLTRLVLMLFMVSAVQAQDEDPFVVERADFRLEKNILMLDLIFLFVHLRVYFRFRSFVCCSYNSVRKEQEKLFFQDPSFRPDHSEGAGYGTFCSLCESSYNSSRGRVG